VPHDCDLTRDIRTVATRSVLKPAPHAGTLYVAIVHSSDGVRFCTAGVSRVELVRRLAEYVRRRSGHTLWANDARHVRSLLARRELEAAVEVYFGRVGDRWDGEWLVTTAILTTDNRRQVTAEAPVLSR
jgi:hypothetical protein